MWRPRHRSKHELNKSELGARVSYPLPKVRILNWEVFRPIGIVNAQMKKGRCNITSHTVNPANQPPGYDFPANKGSRNFTMW